MNGSQQGPDYRRYLPSPATREVIECLWVQDCGPDHSARPTVVMPGGRVELVFHYGDPFEQLVDGQPQRMAACHLVGQRNQSIKVRATGRTGIVIARLQPWGGGRLLGGAVTELRNQVLDLALLWSQASLACLRDQLNAAATPVQRARLVELEIANRLGVQPVDPLAMAAVSRIDQGWGRLSVRQLAADFQLGRRQFSRRFTQAVGASPKQLSSLARAQKAITLIRSGQGCDHIIAQCGYADQSHLIREVVLHCGKAPTALRQTAPSAASHFYNSSNPAAYCPTTYI